jgi:hypothetical protein
MKSLQINVSTLVLLIVWIAIFTSVLTLIFGLYFVTQFQPLKITPESTTRESNVTDRVTEPGVTEPPETEIKNDTDLQNALNEINATDIDELDALLEQNDLDTANF